MKTILIILGIYLVYRLITQTGSRNASGSSEQEKKEGDVTVHGTTKGIMFNKIGEYVDYEEVE